MDYRFVSIVTAMDMWKLSMRQIYRSLAGVCNIIFSVAIVLVTIHLWNPEQGGLMLILIFGCLLFPVLQPLLVYNRAAKQVASLPKHMEMTFQNSGIHIVADGQEADLAWNKIHRVIRVPGMVILSADAGRGYILTDRVLGAQKEEFFEFIQSKIE